MSNKVLDALFVIENESAALIKNMDANEFFSYVLDPYESHDFEKVLIDMENYGSERFYVFDFFLHHFNFYDQFKIFRLYENDSDALYLLPYQEAKKILDVVDKLDFKKYRTQIQFYKNKYPYLKNNPICDEINDFIELVSLAILRKVHILLAIKLYD